MPMFFPTHATETLEQTLGNVTIAATRSVETASKAGLLTTLNSGTKAFSLSYGVALTGASAIDAVTAKNSYSRCMFSIGCGLGAVGTVTSAFTAFNISVVLSPVALVSGATGTAFYWLGRKVNAMARIADVPAL